MITLPGFRAIAACALALALLVPLPRAGAQEPVGVIVAVARLDHFVDRIEALGTLRANESVTLTATVTDTVSALHFDDGDRVDTGELLAEMTSAEEHAQLEEARATVDEAERQYRRVKSLAAQGTASKSLLDEQKREMEISRARLAAIESRLADRLIKAPFAGVVGLRSLSVGALVEPGDVITTLDDDSVMKLEFSVPTTFLDVLQPGLGVEVRARAFGDRVFTGAVKAVDSRVDPDTRSVRVRALVANPDRTLKPGMLMRVDLLKKPRESLVIPEEALIAQGTTQSVLRVDETGEPSVQRREVVIGGRRPGEVEILEGLAPGDRVVTHGTLSVRPGQRVFIQRVDDGSLSLGEQLQRLDKPAAGNAQ
jgi:membrane fusion protein (multidrug efflux system)